MNCLILYTHYIITKNKEISRPIIRKQGKPFGTFIKLMKRLIPVQLLHLLENWLLNCYFGVRQGHVPVVVCNVGPM